MIGTPLLPGPTGQSGAQGVAGEAGPGVPAGGSDGQYLRKDGAADYAGLWSNVAIADVAGLQTALNGKLGTTGNGSALTNLNAAALASGTVPAARLPALPYLSINGGTLNGNLNLASLTGSIYAGDYNHRIWFGDITRHITWDKYEVIINSIGQRVLSLTGNMVVGPGDSNGVDKLQVEGSVFAQGGLVQASSSGARRKLVFADDGTVSTVPA